ncbi:NAD-dependent epimerase/dehydratase family protein [Nitrosopumilus sp.]|uniref:NAD-dependent epimerase/dehydratase family protein n=1 Tax=Nitrosopumilus sp. TaxID=2024843 RepID=UPI003D10171A
MTKILITGGTGFVGSNLVRRLAKSNNEIHLLTKKSSNFWRIKDIKKEMNIHKVDLCEKEKLKKIINKIKPEIIFHIAAYGVQHSENNMSKILESNIIGTFNLFSVLSNQNIKRIINVGSVFEYGESNKKNLSEIDCLRPSSFYEITKNTQTNMANYFFKFRSLPITTLRLFTPYGRFEKKGRLITDIMLSIINKKELKITSPKVARDFIFIDDVIDVMIKASKISNINGETFNIGFGKPHSVENIIKISEKISNQKIQTTIVNRVDKKSKRNGYANINKAKKILNWKPKYSIEKGLKKSYGWYEKNISYYQ